MRAFVAVAALLRATSAFPAFPHVTRDTPRTTTTALAGSNLTAASEPCALISQQWQQSAKGIVDHELAYQCLQSVPLDAEGAALQIEGMKFFAQFQSTLAYLKEPPKGYLYPAVDIVGALDQISDKLAQGKYSNEYDFQMDVQQVVASAYDGHFYYISDITSVFVFARNVSVYSLSTDSLTLPEIYLELPPVVKQNGAARNASISPIATIDNEEVQSWLNKYAAMNGNNQDPDANYNFLSPSVPLGSLGGFTSSVNYLGPHTNVTFKNGTMARFQHFAVSKSNLTGITDGPSFFKKFCTPEGKSMTETEAEASTPSNTSSVAPIIPTTAVPFKAVPSQTAFPGSTGFPAPYVISDDGIIAGYFADEEPDLAVLAISSFEPLSPTTGTTQFSNVVRMFLASAQAANKTRLIVDLRDNSGGQIALAYDLFAQLFPSIEPYGATNFHATPILNDFGRINSDYYSNITNNTAGPEDCQSTYSLAPWNYRLFNNMDNLEFSSWEDFYGPEKHYGDNFTSLVRYDLNDKFAVACSANISNYGNLKDITPPVFQPKDVILVQNGICGSTCAIFSEFMKTQAKVKQVVFGGRKQHGPMQAVGAVKGAQVYALDIILESIFQILDDNTTPDQYQYLNDKYGDIVAVANQTINRAADTPTGKQAAVNVRNNIREGDESFTPLQFIYEAADCRLFLTAEMYAKQSLIWQAAYNAIWNGALCVKGSTGHPSSIPGALGPHTPPQNAYENVSVFPENLIPVS